MKGHLIDAQGLYPFQIMFEQFKKCHLQKLKSCLGLLAYYSKFLHNFSSALSPLHRLLHHSTNWCWTSKEQEAFEASKQLLTSVPLLVHFNADLEITLSYDASPYGLVANSHRMPNGTEKPVRYACLSHTYSVRTEVQPDWEGWPSLCFLCEKIPLLTLFTPVTDHKPLLFLFN